MATTPVALAIMAHPDDIEFLCAGTLLRLGAAGWRLATATMTPGDCGSVTEPPEAIAATRRSEAAAAAALAGAEYHCLEERDLLVFLGPDSLRRVVELLRRVRPTVVITHSPADYMLDHEQTSALVRAACFGAPIRNFATGAAEPAPATEAIPHLYYADPVEGVDPLGQRVQPGLWIDISAEIETKAAMLAAHASQRDWLLRHHGVDEYLDSMRAWSRRRGEESGVAYAEGFRQHLGHAYPHDDRLAAVLGAARQGERA